MDLLKNAYSTTSESDQEDNSGPPLKKIKINTAPDVPDVFVKNDLYVIPGKEVHYNPTAGSLFKPIQGPTQPHLAHSLSAPKNCWTGYVEGFHQNSETFNQQYNTFQRLGYALAPGTSMYNHDGSQNYVGDQQRAAELHGVSVIDMPKTKKGTRKRQPSGDPSTKTYLGPWAAYEEDISPLLSDSELESTPQPSETPAISTAKPEPEPELVTPSEEPEKPSSSLEEDKKKIAKSSFIEKSTFHGKERFDYQGRTYLSPPSDLKVREHDCFIPKKKIHTWTGHTKGVSAIELFPHSAHLLLSADLDGKVKLWDVYNKRRVLRTFHAHAKGITAINFSPDGSQFLTASHDRMCKLWDTETGLVIRRFRSKLPHCVKFYPEDPQIFVAGCADKRIVQWDVREEETVLEYNRHLGAVNSITFVDQNRRFVSTSDDKSIRVWEWNIPVDFKYISEPHMHSMPRVAISPSKKWLACQSLDNQILIYGASERFKLNRKKIFKGHLVAGFACQPDFSTDGKYVISGDSDGYLYVWDWKSQKIYQKIQAHDSACMSVLWHPIEPSRVVTCGWDGRIHYWD